MADIDLIAADARRLHAASGQRDHFRIGNRTGRPDQLGAHLVRLAPVLEALLVRRKDRARVAQAQRQRGRAKLARDQPRHRHGPFADQRDNVSAHVGELEEAAALLGAEPQVEHVHVLDQRSDHVAVTPPPHLAE